MNKKKGEVTKFTQLIRNARNHWKRIAIKDRCLIFIMTILLLQCAYNLFEGSVNTINSANSANIDIVIRTTAAAIFGYFISANFLRRFNDEDEIDKVCTCTTTPRKLSKEEEREKKEEKKNEATYVKAQVIIVTCIGVFALVVLIIARDITSGGIINASASLSQFRDFVSGCVGFLIGIQDEKKENK